MIRARIVAALALSAFTLAVHAQIYRWTDEKGQTHITDTPPPPTARSVETPKARTSVVEGSQTPFELSVAMRDFPVVLYTSPNCGEGCAAARELLNKRAVPFREVQVWNEATNAELKKVSGANEVPTLLVGRSVQRGFEPGAYDALLDSARYPKAGTLPARNQATPAAPEGYVPPAERDARAVQAEPGTVQTEEPPPSGPYSPGSKPPPRRGALKK